MKHILDIKYTNIITIFVCFLYHRILLFQKLHKIITMNNEELSNKILSLRQSILIHTNSGFRGGWGTV